MALRVTSTPPSLVDHHLNLNLLPYATHLGETRHSPWDWCVTVAQAFLFFRNSSAYTATVSEEQDRHAVVARKRPRTFVPRKLRSLKVKQWQRIPRPPAAIPTRACLPGTVLYFISRSGMEEPFERLEALSTPARETKEHRPITTTSPDR